MKVDIGNYPKQFQSGIEEWWFQRKYGKYDFEIDNKTKIDEFFIVINSLYQWFLDVINKALALKERKVKVRIDRQDTYSMDSTLAYIIVPMLKQLKEKKQGSPFVDIEDRPSQFIPDKDNDFIHESWDWLIDEMIWAFTEINTDWGTQYHGDYQESKEPGKLGSFVWSDSEGRKLHEQRINKALQLFGKYYNGLWD